ncbi:PPM-type phosphatase-like domain containing protein [Babesia gibsoni]|uniref:PPM-type phosphatase-like domain containing protein n=1 Tax=Babesia gibsoni TaxID=33632 RepID=A0AAD8LP15_BABGI|nr:PPM-type phosphatase-like domain containing protein [Babesia gibsoni]
MDILDNIDEALDDAHSNGIITEAVALARYGSIVVSAHTDIGGRTSQEDRLVMAPNLIANGHEVAFFGVFDGTVGDFASDTIHRIIVKHLVSTDAWQKLRVALETGEDHGINIPDLAVLALSQMYKNADCELLELCTQHDINYASCTSVTVLLIDEYTFVAHLGDSRASMCYEEGGNLFAKYITTDHKPNHPEEKNRILSAGGSVQYLSTHSNKPFLRGGDFLDRKARGDKPMQIQYSRAFGGKDLKMYGLYSEPEITVFRRGEKHRGLILASDGLWDIKECEQAFSSALGARERGENPSRYLVDMTLKEQQNRSKRPDNITVIVIFFD